MPHPRTLIREAAIAALVDTTSAQERVYPVQKLPYRPKALPVVAVYDTEEESEDEGNAPSELLCNLELQVEAWVSATTGDPEYDVNAAMDDFSLEVHRAMYADRNLGGTVANKGLELVHTDKTVMDDGDYEAGVLIMTFRAPYYMPTPEAVAAGDLDDFEDVANTINLEGVQAPADDTHDQFTVEAP